MVNSHPLYQLSYRGTEKCFGILACGGTIFQIWLSFGEEYGGVDELASFVLVGVYGDGVLAVFEVLLDFGNLGIWGEFGDTILNFPENLGN